MTGWRSNAAIAAALAADCRHHHRETTIGPRRNIYGEPIMRDIPHRAGCQTCKSDSVARLI